MNNNFITQDLQSERTNIGGSTSAYAEFKTLDNKVFIKMHNYKGEAFVLSGWNLYKASAMEIMRGYLRSIQKIKNIYTQQVAWENAFPCFTCRGVQIAFFLT